MSDVRFGTIGAPAAAPEEVRPAQSQGKPGERFADFLKDAIREVDDLQTESAGAINQLLQGEVKDVHSAMLALQRADLSFQLMMQVRNKIVQAYEDIMRMQV